ncbi:MAG TPA: hypothetical protein VEP89_09425 [Draconibacterium sp.]|nr:hypothetical protein [Draconibacterium sp.]
MESIVVYLIERSRNVTLVLDVLGSLIWVIVKLSTRKKNKKNQESNLQELIQLNLAISTCVSGLLLILCAFYTKHLMSLQNLGVSIFIAGLALIYVSIITIFNKKVNGHNSNV